MPMTVDSRTPVLETERLRLRAHQFSDFAHCVAMWSDPAIARHTIGDPSSPQRTWLRLLAYRGHWELMRYGYWAVEEKASCRYVGELGFADFKRDNEPSFAGVPEIGWVLASQSHGKGYATEALKAAVAWADGNLESTSTVCIIHRDNHLSFRVAQKLGYVKILRAATDDKPETIFVRPTPTHR
jgi:RimJ/RimL family protein N-acetyltransferase